MYKTNDIMSKEIVTVGPDTEIVEAAKLLLEKRYNGLPVVDEGGKLVGIICQSDLIAQQKSIPVPTLFSFLDGFIPLTSTRKMESEIQKIAAIKVEDAMTRNPVTVKPDTSIDAVAALMVDNNFHTLPVLDDDGKLVGVVGKEDVLKTLVGGALPV